MNLLSKKPEPAPAAENTEAPAPAASTPVPPIISSLAPDAEASIQIKNALENELAEELGAAVQTAEAEPAGTPPAQSQPEPVQQAQPEPPESKSSEAAQAVHSEPEPALDPRQQEEESAPPRFIEPENPGYINVMQVLVEEKAPKYVKMYGLCQCKRCLEDVKALTLNNLPPKYVVLAEGDRVPRLTVYEGRYSSDITAQLLHSCQAVMNRPHHGRKD